MEDTASTPPLIDPAAPDAAAFAAPSPATAARAEKANILSLSERIGRLRYIVYVLTASVGCVLLLVSIYKAAAFLPQGPAVLLARIAFICIKVVVLPVVFFVLSIRRLHDIDRQGWWVLLLLIPGAALVLACLRGTPGPNRFGLMPPPNNQALRVGALAAPMLLVWMFLSNLEAYRTAREAQPRQPGAPQIRSYDPNQGMERSDARRRSGNKAPSQPLRPYSEQ